MQSILSPFFLSSLFGLAQNDMWKQKDPFPSWAASDVTQLWAELTTLEALLEAFSDDSKRLKSEGSSRGDGMTAA